VPPPPPPGAPAPGAPPSSAGPTGWPERLAALRRWRPPAPLAAAGAGLAAVALVAVAVVAFARSPAPAPPLVLPTVPPAAEAAAAEAPDPGAARRVHVAGAVGRPGVYAAPAAARVADLVEAAGGPAPDADLDRVNLAAPVGDGERVYVPRRGEAAPPPPAGGGAALGGGPPPPPLDLNTADAGQLDALPGVGPATAAAIIEYRAQQGRFRSVEELVEVRGIGEAKLARLRPRVTVR